MGRCPVLLYGYIKKRKVSGICHCKKTRNGKLISVKKAEFSRSSHSYQLLSRSALQSWVASTLVRRMKLRAFTAKHRGEFYGICTVIGLFLTVYTITKSSEQAPPPTPIELPADEPIEEGKNVRYINLAIYYTNKENIILYTLKSYLLLMVKNTI